MHHSLGVNQCLLARGMQVEACCPRCHREVESILHMLCDCPLSKVVWHQLGKRVDNSSFFTSSLQEWLNTNAISKLHHMSGPLPWNHVFLFGIWLIWKDRNLCTFRNKNSNPNLGKEIVERASEYFFCASSSLVFKQTIPKNIRWEKPRAGWYTLNTVGSAASNSGLAGGGGLIRDE